VRRSPFSVCDRAAGPPIADRCHLSAHGFPLGDGEEGDRAALALARDSWSAPFFRRRSRARRRRGQRRATRPRPMEARAKKVRESSPPSPPAPPDPRGAPGSGGQSEHLMNGKALTSSAAIARSQRSPRRPSTWITTRTSPGSWIPSGGRPRAPPPSPPPLTRRDLTRWPFPVRITARRPRGPAPSWLAGGTWNGT